MPALTGWSPTKPSTSRRSRNSSKKTDEARPAAGRGRVDLGAVWLLGAAGVPPGEATALDGAVPGKHPGRRVVHNVLTC